MGSSCSGEGLFIQLENDVHVLLAYVVAVAVIEFKSNESCPFQRWAFWRVELVIDWIIRVIMVIVASAMRVAAAV